MAIHATGLYPEWWEGRRFDGPVSVWTGSESNEASRDIVQKALLGDPEGTGWLPKENIVKAKSRQAGVPDVIDTIKVKHKSGGISTITLKTYEQGRKKWQGTSKHVIWLDEESPMEIFTEALTRTLDVKGLILQTFTPLLGNTDVVQHFVNSGKGIFYQNVTWDDAPHLDAEEKLRLANSYPAWERDARIKGIPMLGSGVVYPISDDDIKVTPFEIPAHWARICGMDFGIDHPAALVWLAWDRDADVLYLYDAYRKSNEVTAIISQAIKDRGAWIPVAWPHDGVNREKGTGIALWKQYRDHGVTMLKYSARYLDDKGGRQDIEPAVIDILERMKTGRLKVFSHLGEWFEEKRMYHRKDGKIVDVKDDLMSATRYAVMMKRKARTNNVSAMQFKPKYTRAVVGGRR